MKSRFIRAAQLWMSEEDVTEMHAVRNLQNGDDVVARRWE